jgi:hypothetical protein
MRFLEEFRCKDYRNIYLENSIIDTLLEYLLRRQVEPTLGQDLSKIEALIWLREFLLFFQEDFNAYY